MNPKDNDCCLYKQRRGCTETQLHREEAGVKMEAETGVSGYRTRGIKDCQQPPEAGGGEKGFFLTAIQKSMSLPTPWFGTSSLQNTEKIHFCYFKPRHSWGSAMIALGNIQILVPGIIPLEFHVCYYHPLQLPFILFELLHFCFHLCLTYSDLNKI